MSKKRNLIFLALLILGALLLTSCLPKPPVTEGVLKGQVMVPEGTIASKDFSGQALPDATVNIIDLETDAIIASTTTNSNGTYQVFVPAGGPYLFEAVKDGMKIQQITCQVETGIEYDLGIADCVTTSAALIAQVMIDAGDNPTDIDCAAIQVDSNFNDVASIVCNIIEAGGDPTSSAAVEEAVEDFLHPPAPLSKPINIKAIPGVTVPATGETPIGTITETAQYEGMVTWAPDDIPFRGSTVYTATITLTPKAGFTLSGVTENFFTVAGTTAVTNTVNQGVVTAGFPETAAATLESITITSPASKLTYSIGDTLDITDLVITGTYNDTTTRVETISSADISGFDSSAPEVDKILMITFGEKTTTYKVTIIPTPLTAIAAITGTPQVGVELTAGALTPTDATAIYQWQICTTSDGTYEDITGATSNNYTPIAEDAAKFIKIAATGTGNYNGNVISAVTAAVANGEQTAPTGLTGVAPTTYGGTNGKITGTTVDMEYKLVSGDTYVACSATETTVSAGTYQVRYKAKTGYNVGTAVEVVVPEPLLVIGNSYGGGKVAYFFVEGESGYVAGEQHGLIAAATDLDERNQWYNNNFVTTNAIGTSIGTGQVNTEIIVTTQGTGGYAAYLCYRSTEGGYDDWYLPSKDELHKLYINRDAIGGFTTSTYWSSSEYDATYVWFQWFYAGSWDHDFPKDYTLLVRAVRNF